MFDLYRMGIASKGGYRHVGDIMLVMIFGCWWRKRIFVAFFRMLVPMIVRNICYFSLKTEISPSVCWRHYVGDCIASFLTGWCWWLFLYVGVNFYIFIRHQHRKVVTNWFRHQHRCIRKGSLVSNWIVQRYKSERWKKFYWPVLIFD